MPGPLVSLLTDYGSGDGFVGVLHGVILAGCPPARILDLEHGIPVHDVRAGAVVLERCLGHLPVGVHLADVDPDGAGGTRAIALALADGRRLLGPDNGLLASAVAAAGGAVELVDLTGSPIPARAPAATFRGRDLLAPVAAALAAGAPLRAVGAPADPASLRALELPRARLRGRTLHAHVLAVDRFGNLELDARPDELPAPRTADRLLETDAGTRRVAHVDTFAAVAAGALLLYADPQGRLALAVNRGSAAVALGLAAGDPVRLT